MRVYYAIYSTGEMLEPMTCNLGLGYLSLNKLDSELKKDGYRIIEGRTLAYYNKDAIVYKRAEIGWLEVVE